MRVARRAPTGRSRSSGAGSARRRGATATTTTAAAGRAGARSRRRPSPDRRTPRRADFATPRRCAAPRAAGAGCSARRRPPRSTARADAVLIMSEARTTWSHQLMIILHELAHLICEHPGHAIDHSYRAEHQREFHEISPQALAAVLGDEPPSTRRRRRSRTKFGSSLYNEAAEREAETMATIMSEWVPGYGGYVPPPPKDQLHPSWATSRPGSDVRRTDPPVGRLPAGLAGLRGAASGERPRAHRTHPQPHRDARELDVGQDQRCPPAHPASTRAMYLPV
ncbi:MAG: hypothetical protein JWP64_2337 [Pseudonocardia sp.]|nr:hypothetical protein [Pseudonocardia sp.]